MPPAGLVNLNSVIRGRFQNASIAYAAFPPTAGRGYMTEGLGLAVRYAFGELRLHRLEAQIQPDNHASLRLVRRAGRNRTPRCRHAEAGPRGRRPP